TVSAENPYRRRILVSRIFRAGRRIRFGVAAHDRRASRRSIRRQRPEDLDNRRAYRRLDFLPCAHVAVDRAQAGWHFVSSDRYAFGGNYGASLDPHGRRARSERGV